MKIAMTHVDLPNESKGGVAAQAHHLSNQLVERGHEVTVFSFSPHYSECKYQVHQYLDPPKQKFLQPLSFATRLAQTDFSEFDIVHTHGDNYLLWKTHPHIRTFHGSAIDEMLSAVTWRRRIYQLLIAGLEDVGARVADFNVGISNTTQKRIPAVSQIIPCGVDLSHFRPGEKSPNPSILFVGTVTGRKRGALLADLFRREIKPHCPKAELWSVADQPMEGDGIINFGRVSQEKLYELYQKAWVLCLPSTYEGFGIPYIEAMASGTAVVASPNPGAEEILDNGEHGIVAQDDQLSSEIKKLLIQTDLRTHYVEKGLVRSQAYSWDNVASLYEKVYQECINR